MATSAPARSTQTLQRDLTRQQERLRTAIDEREDARLVGLLAEVEKALGRIETRSYGVCETCHESLGEATLAVDPLISVCIEHWSEPERRRLESDLELASRVQLRLLPEPGLRAAGWEVAYHYEPMGPVGGDYCDLVRTAGGDFYFFLGDVSGKGVAASLLAAQLHGLFRTLVALELPLETMIERANRIFCESVLAGHFATLVAGRACAGGTIDLVNAGHPSPLVVSEGRSTPVVAGGRPLGLFCEGGYPGERLSLAPGESLLLFTDGLSESFGPEREEYGTKRTGRVAAESYATADELVKACLADVSAFRAGAPCSDDVTVMALRRRE